MGMFTRLIDLMLDRYTARRRQRNKEAVASLGATLAPEGPRQTSPTRTFTIKEAMNGHYIEFVRYKFNPNKADDYETCVYIVRDGETLVDAISAVLVMMDRPAEL